MKMMNYGMRKEENVISNGEKRDLSVTSVEIVLGIMN